MTMLAACKGASTSGGGQEPTQGTAISGAGQTGSGTDESASGTEQSVNENASGAAYFAQDDCIYGLKKILGKGGSGLFLTSNDNEMVMIKESYDYDHANETYPDDVHVFEVSYLDADGKETGNFVLKYDSGDYLREFQLDSKGNLYFMRSISNYDDDRGYFNAYELLTYDKSGELKGSVIFEDAGYDFYVKDILVDDKDRYMALTNEGLMIIKDYEVADRIPYDDAEDFVYCYGLHNGNVLVTSYGEELIEAYEIDIDSRRRVKADIPIDLRSADYTFSGNDSDLIFSCGSGLYSYNIGDKEPVPIMAYPALDKYLYDLDYVSVMDNKDVVGVFYDSEEGNYVAASFEKKDMSKDEREKIVLVGVGMSDAVLTQACDHNRTSRDSRIVIHDYAKKNFGTDYTEGVKALDNAVRGGEEADVIYLSYGLPYHAYMSKGLLADLRPLLEADASLNEDDYAPNVIEALSDKGRFMMFCPDFYISTAISYSYMMGDRMAFTLNDFLSNVRYSGASVYPSDEVNSSIMYNIIKCSAGDYIDWNNFTCSFDSSEFKKILSYLSSYPSDYDYNSGDGNESPYNAYPLPFRNGDALCDITTLYDANGYVEATQGVFGDHVTLVGFPTTGDMGSTIGFNYAVAISENSTKKDLAWNFVRRFFDVDYTKDRYHSFPTAKKALKEEIASAGHPYEYGDGTVEDRTYLVGPDYVNITPLSKSECDEFEKMIYKINRLEMDDQEIVNILSEETTAYFMGAYDVSTALSAIQERVTKYLEGVK